MKIIPYADAQEVSSITDYTNLRLEVIAGATFLLLDTFTDTNGTALTSHTMDIGPGWARYSSGTWTIQSNQATQTATEDLGAWVWHYQRRACVPATNAGTSCAVTITTPASGTCSGSLLAWCDSAATTRYEMSINFAPGLSQLTLIKDSATVETVNYSWAFSASYTLMLTWDGTHIIGYVNGVSNSPTLPRAVQPTPISVCTSFARQGFGRERACTTILWLITDEQQNGQCDE